MSEEILRALTQLFAIITKQDDGVSESERTFVHNFFRSELDLESTEDYLALYDKFSGYTKQISGQVDKPARAPSVQDSIKTLGLCKKINKTLEQKQKVFVLMKILEIAGADKNFTGQEMEIINTISTVFNISKEEYVSIEAFVTSAGQIKSEDKNLVSITSELANEDGLKFHGLLGVLNVVRIPSVDMYFLKYIGNDELLLNGFAIKPDSVQLFSNGSTIRTSHGDALYYSDLISHFNPEVKAAKLSFYASIEELKFANGGIGLRNIEICEGPGKLVGIMGASGAGKTTLLNVLAGIVKPTSGQIRINGFDIHKEKNKIGGVIGYVSQDDLLIEELTVYQNLYYNAKLCFANLSEEEIHAKVESTLESLGLEQRKDLRVGSVLDKTISGGQRKRLNIALELIRQPSVLFVDEPTSGLSSRDSENVIDLLKELTLMGKLIFVVIHQPSSDIYKMFDKMYLMDTGGYPVYYGNPVEAVTYFKTITNQVDRQRGQCEICGNVNPEQIFNIIEAKIVDEYGQRTTKRKINPAQWHAEYEKNFKLENVQEINEKPKKTLNIPSKIIQATTFLTRDFLSKISNKQYLLINLLEAPVLAVILAFVIRYTNVPEDNSYVFRFNENIPAFLLMAIVVALFMGLTVSAEEIIRDRKILKRESFLNLSWSSYLFSKIGLLFFISGIQTLSFVAIGNLILEMPGMFWNQWFVLFSCSAFANILGLNISSGLKSAVTVYVLIPLLLIPQMVLSGLLFNFDKLNDLLSTKGKVPLIADLMTSRWAYEALAVDHFVNNEYESPYYKYEKEESMADYKSAFLVDKLDQKRRSISSNITSTDELIRKEVLKNIKIIRDNLETERFTTGLEGIDFDNALTIEGFTDFDANLKDYLKEYKKFYQNRYTQTVKLKEQLMMQKQSQEDYNLNDVKNSNYNESMADLVRNISVSERIVEYDGRLIQQINPIFTDPSPQGFFDYRTHFFAPKKHLAGALYSTYGYNLSIIWLMSLFLYVSLYFEWLRKLIGINIRRRK